MTYLDRMQPGQRGKVVGFVDDSPVARRLVEMGVVPGELLEYLRNAPLRDPLEIRVGASFLSLRRAEASLVAIEVDE
ncbi:MAG: ferrous iron transport protein A [candidate division Zixibacteria bacterium]|nr:ferrous iron transport protein A [candidate division Zixibacteria bacterium]